jgi:hypothetical protein
MKIYNEKYCEEKSPHHLFFSAKDVPGKERWGECVKYTEGDTVKFKLKSGELLEGDVLFIERSPREDVLYINSSNKWAYKVPEKRIISKVLKKNKSIKPKNRTSPWETFAT